MCPELIGCVKSIQTSRHGLLNRRSLDSRCPETKDRLRFPILEDDGDGPRLELLGNFHFTSALRGVTRRFTS